MSNRSQRRGRPVVDASQFDSDKDETEHGSRAGFRGVRLERSIERELRAMVSDDVRDPDAQRARVLRVELSVDYRNARIYWTHDRSDAALTSTRARVIEAALDRCASFLRAGLGEALAMDRVPLLRFVYEANPPSQWLDDAAREEESCE